jgi:hypothetical protein
MKTEYKDTILIEYHSAIKKTRHVKVLRKQVTGLCTPFNKVIQNAKRRPVVQARIKKLRKYQARAWKGYSFGKVIKK